MLGLAGEKVRLELLVRLTNSLVLLVKTLLKGALSVAPVFPILKIVPPVSANARSELRT